MRRTGIPSTDEKEAADKTATATKSIMELLYQSLQDRIMSKFHGEVVLKVRFHDGHITQATLGGDEYIKI